MVRSRDLKILFKKVMNTKMNNDKNPRRGLTVGLAILIIALCSASGLIVQAQYHSDSFLDHYWIEHIGTQTVGQEFTVRITAKDQYGDTYTGYNGIGYLTDFTGISIPVHFSFGEAEAKVTIKSPFSNDKVSVDGHGESNAFNVNYSSIFFVGISSVVAGVSVGLVGTAILYSKKKKRSSVQKDTLTTDKAPLTIDSTPTQIKLFAEPLTVVADGASKSTLTLELLDKEDKPAPALAELTVKLFASRGKLAQPTITIPQGSSTVKTFITASTERGIAVISSSAEGLHGGEVALNFKEEELHCLYCGSLTPSLYEPCPKCGRIPP
jgi:hypothetical protein